MFNLKYFLACFVVVLMLGFTPCVIYAESVKFVHWFNQYLPLHGKLLPGGYQGKHSIQYQDVNDDSVYNDALIWFGFGLGDPLNPALYRDTGKQQHRYRVDYPSARFYGGIVARFTNVSHITEKDRKGNKIPFFRGIQQSTVQPTEGGRPCSYSTNSPHDTGRAWSSEGFGTSWGDMTVMIVNDGGECCPISDKFQKTKKAEVNFTSVFLWKKEDFINGGGTAEKITFDKISKLSVDVTRFRKNVEESRFVVQDGNQLWISEGQTKAIYDENDDLFWVGEKGINVNDLGKGKMGAIVELNPLNSRWAIYTPFSGEDQIQTLFEELEQMAFNPKKATESETQLYQEKSDKLLDEINQIEFKPTKATFVEHHFEDVQAVGIYFATYPFAHETTQLVFDNFQAYATGTIAQGKAVAINPQDDSLVNTSTQFTGGISVNCGPYEQIVTQCVPDKIDIRGNITVDHAHVDKRADILVVAAHKPYIEAEDEQFYVLGKKGTVVEPWDGNMANLKAFQENILLEPEHSVQMYTGQLQLPGFIRFFFGYRLQNGTIVYNEKSLDIILNPENTHSSNQLPYTKSIKNLCQAAKR